MFSNHIRVVYRTSTNLNVCVPDGLTTSVTAFLTVSYQSIKAALANPVETLRYE